MNLIFVAKIISFIAFLLTCYGYIQTKDNVLRMIIAICSILLAIHFLLMLAWVPAIILFINAIRNQLSLYYRGFSWFLSFAIFQIIVSAFFYQNYKDLFPILGSLFSGYALFCTDKIQLRIWMFLCSLLWLVNNTLYLSYGAMLANCLAMSMNAYGMYKIVKLNRTIRTSNIKMSITKSE